MSTIANDTLLSTMALKDLTDLVSRKYEDNPRKIKPMARKLFQIDSIPDHTGTTREMAEYDTETFARDKAEAVNVRKVKAGTGYSKMLKLHRIGAEIDVTYEMMKYNKHQEVFNKIVSLSNFCVQRQELDLTHRFTFASQTSYVNMDGRVVDTTTADGVSLVNGVHGLAFSPVTYSNRLTGDPVFSQSALEAIEIMASAQILSNFGEKRVMDFDTLVISDHTPVKNEARRLMQSTAEVSAPNAGVVNVYKASYDVVSLPYLATTQTGARDNNKKNYWFLLASTQWSGYLAEWEAERLISPSTGNNMENAHNDTRSYGTRAGYDICVVSGRGILGSLNAS